MIGEPEARRGRSNPRLAEVGVNHAVYVTILIFYSTLAVRNTPPPPPPPPSLIQRPIRSSPACYSKELLRFISFHCYIAITTIIILIFASIAYVFFYYYSYYLSLWVFGFWSNMRFWSKEFNRNITLLYVSCNFSMCPFLLLHSKRQLIKSFPNCLTCSERLISSINVCRYITFIRIWVVLLHLGLWSLTGSTSTHTHTHTHTHTNINGKQRFIGLLKHFSIESSY